MMRNYGVACIALIAAASLAAPTALAQSYPNKSIKIIAPVQPGGGVDLVARQVGERLTNALGQPVVIENQSGGGGIVGSQATARSAPDGYTLIVNSVGPIAVNPTLYKGLTYNPLTDLVPIVQFADVPNVLVVATSLGVRNFEELIAYAKANPGKLNYGSTGIGTSSHLSGYMFCQRAGIAATHIPYKGAEALNDLLAGRVQFMFATIPSVIQHIQAGKLVPVAVSSLKRSRSLPDVPSISERGVADFDTGSWFGLFAPKGTPEAVITQLNNTVNEILAMPAIERQMVREGADPAGGTSGAFREFVQREYEKWKLIVRESGATAE